MHGHSKCSLKLVMKWNLIHLSLKSLLYFLVHWMWIMHQSMWNPRVGGGCWQAIQGKLTPWAFLWVWILTFGCCSCVGNLTWPSSWKTKRTWKQVPTMGWTYFDLWWWLQMLIIISCFFFLFRFLMLFRFDSGSRENVKFPWVWPSIVQISQKFWDFETELL